MKQILCNRKSFLTEIILLNLIFAGCLTFVFNYQVIANAFFIVSGIVLIFWLFQVFNQDLKNFENEMTTLNEEKF